MTLEEAIDALRSGGIVAYPTETFYGLGVDARNPQALGKLQQLKDRSAEKAFPLLLPDREYLSVCAQEIPEGAQKLIDRYWPGPLTLILIPKDLPELLRGPTGGCGFRLTSHPVANELVRRFESCVTTTSANRSGEEPARTVAGVRKTFADPTLGILDGGTTAGVAPSTVIDFTEPKPVLVREGAISWHEILGTLERE